MSTETPLLPLIKRYVEKDPLDAARQLEALKEEEGLEILNSLPGPVAAEVIKHLPNAVAANLLKQLSQESFQTIVSQLDPQQGATLFLDLPKDSRTQYLGYLSKEKKDQIQELLTYPEDSAGRLMSTKFIAFHEELKARDAIEKIRELVKKGAPASYVYVVDRENHLVGIMNMRDMMLAPPDAALSTVMRTNLYAIDSFMDREKVANELSTRKFFAAPVVDSENHLLGVVRAEQLIGQVQEEATEDILKMFGAGGDERAFSSMGFSLRKRLPWLHVNLATAFLAASVVALFEDIIAKITVLAVYLPVVAGQGGNAGAQSLAVVMRGLVMREIPPQKVKGLIFKETVIGLINGIVIGVVTAGIAWFWQGNPYMGLVIGLGMVVNLAIAGFAGAAIPLTMKAIKLDPAQCSNIILTTVTDVMGFFAFLGFAVLFQKYLI